MLFEARGVNNIIIESDRVECIKLKFKAYLSDFVVKCLGSYELKLFFPEDKEFVETLDDAGLREYYLLNKGMFLSLFWQMREEFLSLWTLDQMLSYLSYDNSDERFNDEDYSGSSMFSIEKLLRFGTSRGREYILNLAYIFNHEFKDVLIREIKEQLKDIEDVKSGRPITRLSERKAKEQKERDDYLSMLEDGRRAMDELYELGAFDDD